MSNRVNLTYTKFTNLDSKGNELYSSYGYRIYDDFGQDYNNCFDNIEELKSAINEDTILAYISDNHNDFLESVTEKEGLYFNGNWLEIHLKSFKRKPRCFAAGRMSVILSFLNNAH